jgi:hypothetical protein
LKGSRGFSLKIRYKISKLLKFNQIYTESKVKCAESSDQHRIAKFQLEECETVSQVTHFVELRRPSWFWTLKDGAEIGGGLPFGAFIGKLLFCRVPHGAVF